MDKEIDRIAKNPETDIIIRIDEFNGRKGLTIREFVKSERYTGFTKAGTRIPADKFGVFKAAINSIKEDDLKEPHVAHSPAPAKSEPPTESKSPKQSADLEEVEF